MKITDIINYGTIVQVVVDEGNPINMDHRCFQDMVAIEKGKLIGREIVVHGDEFEQNIEFVD